jgi:hypothetical protein
MQRRPPINGCRRLWEDADFERVQQEWEATGFGVPHDPYRDLTETVEAFLTATDARVGEMTR